MSAACAPPQDGRPPDPPTILIVDDAAQSLTVLGELLAPAYRVRVANSGQRALELAALEPLPDLILLDVMMPDMNGHAVLTQLRSQERTRDLPVIFVTALDATEDEQRGFDLGAADYIVKPFRAPIVLARVQTHLDLKRARDLLRERNIALAAELEERRRSEARIRELNEALQRSLANLESFSYSVSHDLRAPLRAMNGFAQLLLMDVESGAFDKMPELVERISASADRMGTLIDGLLAVGRIGHAALKYESVDMNRLIDDIVGELDNRARAYFDIGQLHVIRADATTLRQAFTNLISNALKYSARSPQPEISIRCLVTGSEVIYSVRDNGAGFDAQYAGKLFGVFQRLHQASEFEGNGVGLAIVRAVVELHGGRVWADGRPGQGAIFHVALPIGLLEP